MVTSFTYLFPRNLTEAVASGRQRKSTFAQFVISTPIWAILILITVSMMRTPPTQASDTSVADLQAAQQPADPTLDETTPATAVAVTQATPATPTPEATSATAAAGTDISSAPALSAAIPEVAAAIERAFASGRPERWSANGEKGYAIPSAAEPSSGCKSIYYSVDSSGFQSEPQKVCS
jgi:hypothetical protein